MLAGMLVLSITSRRIVVFTLIYQLHMELTQGKTALHTHELTRCQGVLYRVILIMMSYSKQCVFWILHCLNWQAFFSSMIDLALSKAFLSTCQPILISLPHNHLKWEKIANDKRIFNRIEKGKSAVTVKMQLGWLSITAQKFMNLKTKLAPDTAYSVREVAQHCSYPGKKLWKALERCCGKSMQLQRRIRWSVAQGS